MPAREKRVADRDENRRRAPEDNERLHVRVLEDLGVCEYAYEVRERRRKESAEDAPREPLRVAEDALDAPVCLGLGGGFDGDKQDAAYVLEHLQKAEICISDRQLLEGPLGGRESASFSGKETVSRPGRKEQQAKTLRATRRRDEKANVLENAHKAEVLQTGRPIYVLEHLH